MKNPTKKDLPKIVKALSPIVEEIRLQQIDAIAWRIKMDEWEREYLRENQLTIAVNFLNEGQSPWRLTDPSETYLMTPEDSETFFTARQKYIDSLGCTLEPGFCPALVAEERLRQKENELIEAARPFFGEHMTSERLVGMRDGISTRKRYLILLTGLVRSYEGRK